VKLDRYAASLLKLTKRRYAEWHASHPVAADIKRPAVAGPLRKIDSVHGISLPVEDEDWPSRTFAERAIHALFRSPVYPLRDDEEVWHSREDARREMRELLPDQIMPDENAHWHDLLSDEAQSHFAFSGLGAFHLRQMPALDNEDARFVVDMTHMEKHDVRPGFERFGAAAYFGEDRKILRIHWSHVGHDIRPGDPDWPHAKLAWRSAVLVGLTVSDHQWGLHMRLGNTVITATRERLGVEHPVRLLLKPYCFRTVAVNHRAANVLIGERGLTHRALALTFEGLSALLLDGERDAKLRPFPDVLAERRTEDLEDFPFAEDGLDLYAVIHQYVREYIHLYLPSNDHVCADVELARWWEALAEVRDDDRSLRTRAQLTDAVSAFIFSVVALHEHMGELAEYVRDPGFAAGRLRPGAVMNDVQGTFLLGLLVAGSGLSQPDLISDFSHLLPSDRRETAVAILEAYRVRLGDLSAEIDRRNLGRKQPYNSMNPSKLQCSVSI